LVSSLDKGLVNEELIKKEAAIKRKENLNIYIKLITL
jgi:hypothetical protein|tara:strand:+ start:4160 stop:4270 length:111 start_codon:yes stop_codon:yes gene_type:complete